MIVPTGRALRATSTLGPSGTAGAAAACCAPAPVNMFLAMTAVMTAMTRAPMSKASFFTFMARSPPLEGLTQLPHTSGKLVKKPLGENRETAERDRDSIWNLGPALPVFDAVPDEQAERQNAAANRHQHQELHRHQRREPQRPGPPELDVAAPHPTGTEGAPGKREDDPPRGGLERDA